MKKNIELVEADLFSEPSDLIILPCSSNGAITTFVRQRLDHFNIPIPPIEGQIGDVIFHKFKGGETIAQEVGYAISVHDFTSNYQAIEKIAKNICEHVNRSPEINSVSIPLFGTGAGGLRQDKVVMILNTNFDLYLEQNVHMKIFVLQRYGEKNLSLTLRKSRSEIKASIPRVFVSYSRNNSFTLELSEKIATKLRESSINSRLDKWHLRNGMELPDWMSLEIDQANKVLIVTDSSYADKANGKLGGVGWETRIIQGDIFANNKNNEKYLIVNTEIDFDKGMPDYLRNKFCMHWTETMNFDECFSELLAEINGTDLAPPIRFP